MSRHVVARSSGFAIIGFDRPLQHFFVQTWSKADNLTGSYIMYCIEDVQALSKKSRIKTPPELYIQLEMEAAGFTDTNTCKDWRQP